MSDEPDRLSVPPDLPRPTPHAATVVEAHDPRVALRLACDLVRATVAAEARRIDALAARVPPHPAASTFPGELAALRRALADAQAACDAVAIVASREGAP